HGQRVRAGDDLALRQGALVDDGPPVSAERLPADVRGRDGAGPPGLGGGRPRLLRRPRHRPRRQDPGPVPRAAPDRRQLPGAGGGHPVSLPGWSLAAVRRWPGAAERAWPVPRPAFSRPPRRPQGRGPAAAALAACLAVAALLATGAAPAPAPAPTSSEAPAGP